MQPSRRGRDYREPNWVSPNRWTATTGGRTNWRRLGNKLGLVSLTAIRFRNWRMHSRACALPIMWTCNSPTRSAWLVFRLLKVESLLIETLTTRKLCNEICSSVLWITTMQLLRHFYSNCGEDEEIFKTIRVEFAPPNAQSYQYKCYNGKQRNIGLECNISTAVKITPVRVNSFDIHLLPAWKRVNRPDGSGDFLRRPWLVVSLQHHLVLHF